MKNKKQIYKINLSEIKNPDFLRDLSYQQLDSLSSQIRDYLLFSTSNNGGHIASNLGVVETTISLCRSFDFSKDKLIFDVGHQCYTYKVLTGRSLDKLRQKDGISGFQKMAESPYDHFEAGHSSTSISVASGMAIARDLKKENYNIVAFIGDSSVSNGLAFEAINDLSPKKHKVIIVLNDNNMSISKPVGGLSNVFRKLSASNFYIDSKNFIYKICRKTRLGRHIFRKSTSIKNWFKRKLINQTIFDTLGYSVIGPIDGHYIKALDQAFAKAKKMQKSVVVFVKTIKGKGYPYAEKDQVGDWHGVSRFNIETGEKLTKSEGISWSKVYSTVLNETMKSNDKIITIAPATEHGSSLDSVFKMYPDRSFDVGIAEEHAFTMAGGLAVSGNHPVICIYSTFMQRAFDEISHDLARMKLNATILIDRSGLVGNDGETHQGIYDEAFLYTIPNISIAMATKPSQSLSIMKESLNNHGVFAIRFPRENVIYDSQIIENVPFGCWKKELTGKDVAIISVGPITEKLKELMTKNKVEATLYSAIYLRPFDCGAIKELLGYKKVIIYDAYATKEGFANSVFVELFNKGFKGKCVLKTVPTEFVKQATIEEQREQFEITPEDILKII